MADRDWSRDLRHNRGAPYSGNLASWGASVVTRFGPWTIDWPRLLLVGLAVTVVIAIGVVGATSETAFGPYNPGWEGSSDLRAVVDDDPAVDASYAADTGIYEEVAANASVVFVIAPEEEYGAEDRDRMEAFLERGGTLVVMENFGTAGQALLTDLDAEASIDGRLVRDERNHAGAPTMPIATEITSHPYTDGVSQITLNHASAIDPGDSTVLVETSQFAYLVADPDVEITDEDELASVPVVTVESVGAGELVTISDPSIAINVMLAEPDNTPFLANLWADQSYVVFDLSHSGGLPPFTAAALAVRESVLLQIGIGLLGILVIAGMARAVSVINIVRRVASDRVVAASIESPPLPVSDADRIAYLQSQHPDWERERIERVIGALNRPDGKWRDR